MVSSTGRNPQCCVMSLPIKRGVATLLLPALKGRASVARRFW